MLIGMAVGIALAAAWKPFMHGSLSPVKSLMESFAAPPAAQSDDDISFMASTIYQGRVLTPEEEEAWQYPPEPQYQYGGDHFVRLKEGGSWMPQEGISMKVGEALDEFGWKNVWDDPTIPRHGKQNEARSRQEPCCH